MTLITIKNISGEEINVACYPFKTYEEKEIEVSAGAMQDDVDVLVSVDMIEIV